MSSPRLIASLLTMSAAAVLIASCGEQTLPTVPSSVTSSTALQASVTEYFDTLVDPASAPHISPAFSFGLIFLLNFFDRK